MLPSLRRLDQRLEADVGKVGDGKDVHDAPGMVGGIAAQLAPDRFAHRAARAVAADDVARPDGLDLALMPGIEPLEADGHRVVFETAPPVEVLRSSRRRE